MAIINIAKKKIIVSEARHVVLFILKSQFFWINLRSIQMVFRVASNKNPSHACSILALSICNANTTVVGEHFFILRVWIGTICLVSACFHIDKFISIAFCNMYLTGEHAVEGLIITFLKTKNGLDYHYC